MRCFAKALPLALVPMLVSCATSQPRALTTLSSATSPKTSAIDPLCSEVEIVKVSTRDTTETIAAVIRNNAAIRAACR